MTSYEAIFRRRSIRKYKNDEISPTMLEKIERFGEDAVGIRPDIRVKWKIFRKEDHQLKGLFRVDAPYYVALYSEICEDYRKNAGCLMEQLSLYLFTKGIGSCYQGGAKLKTDIEKDLESMSKKDLQQLRKKLTKQMHAAAAELNFELAATLRDQMMKVVQQLNE